MKKKYIYIYIRDWFRTWDVCTLPENHVIRLTCAIMPFFPSLLVFLSSGLLEFLDRFSLRVFLFFSFSLVFHPFSFKSNLCVLFIWCSFIRTYNNLQELWNWNWNWNWKLHGTVFNYTVLASSCFVIKLSNLFYFFLSKLLVFF